MGEVVWIVWVCGMRVLMGRVACGEQLVAANDPAFGEPDAVQ